MAASLGFQGVAGNTARALVACVALASSHAHAETAREEIERKGLDLHPKPVLIHQGFTIEGQIAIGLAQPASGEDSGVQAIAPNWVGLRGIELLDSGWYAQFALEASFDPATGKGFSKGTGKSTGKSTGKGIGKLAWDRDSYVGLGHRAWGRIQLGLRAQPALAVVALADPLDGGVGEAGDWLYRLTAMDAPKLRNRTADAVTWELPPLGSRLKAVLQVGIRNAADEDTQGLSVVCDCGLWRLGLAWQSWQDGHSYALPVVARRTFEGWTGWAALTVGQLNGVNYTTTSLGATFRPIRGPRPASTTVQLTRLDSDHSAVQWRWAAGRETPLSAATSWHFTAVVQTQPGATTRAGAELGLRHRFSL